MGFQIFRLEKHKSIESIAQAAGHQLRSAKPAHVDRAKEHLNTYVIPGVGGLDLKTLSGRSRQNLVLDRYKALLPKNVRSNAVHAIEFMVSGTPEHLKAAPKELQRAYLSDAGNFIAKNFGGLGNLLWVAMHYDEQTCGHLSIGLMPLKDGKLNAKAYIDGPKHLSLMQTSFHEEVAKKYGLERGEIGSSDVHVSPKEFYEGGREFARLEKERRRLEKEARRAEYQAKKEAKKDGLEF